ncbi:hypothetical protein AYO20_04311 [Fonsecaea nubica]|uniref:Uncharacterized protein n=1 Tax=Fonsecaea nubica TaxID=856822 RepID=A0A178D5M0_9EURO|nr:hypothetical protein AYO20_04311 [Fonsecaea nubica]OAL36415.1 hypothetical protein AYO20_04311 [Fonsecaea nubica]
MRNGLLIGRSTRTECVHLDRTVTSPAPNQAYTSGQSYQQRFGAVFATASELGSVERNPSLKRTRGYELAARSTTKFDYTNHSFASGTPLSKVWKSPTRQGIARNQGLGYLTTVRSPASTVLLAVKVSCDNVSGTRIVDCSLAEQAAPPVAARENVEPEYADVIGWMLDPSWVDTASSINTTTSLQIPITAL